MRFRRTPSEGRLTRREWTLLLGASPLAASIAQPPAVAPPNGGSVTNLPKAVAEVQRVSDRLSKIEVPMNVEPAVSFKA